MLKCLINLFDTIFRFSINDRKLRVGQQLRPGPNSTLNVIDGKIPNENEIFTMRGINHGIDLRYNINKNKLTIRVRYNTFNIPPMGISNDMICDEHLKVALLGLNLKIESDNESNDEMETENDLVYLIEGSEFNYEGVDYCIKNVDIEDGEILACNIHNNSYRTFTNLIQINNSIAAVCNVNT